MRHFTALSLAVASLLAGALAAAADIGIGATAPNFSKAELVGTSAGPQHTLYQHAAQSAAVLFLLGND